MLNASQSPCTTLKEVPIRLCSSRISLPSELRDVWIAAHYLKRLRRQEITAVNIPQSALHILRFTSNQHVSLRMSAGLLFGIIILYDKQLEFLLQTCRMLLQQVARYTTSHPKLLGSGESEFKRVVKHSARSSWKENRRKIVPGGHRTKRRRFITRMKPMSKTLCRQLLATPLPNDPAYTAHVDNDQLTGTHLSLDSVVCTSPELRTALVPFTSDPFSMNYTADHDLPCLDESEYSMAHSASHIQELPLCELGIEWTPEKEPQKVPSPQKIAFSKTPVHDPKCNERPIERFRTAPPRPSFGTEGSFDIMRIASDDPRFQTKRALVHLTAQRERGLDGVSSGGSLYPQLPPFRLTLDSTEAMMTSPHFDYFSLSNALSSPVPKKRGLWSEIERAASKMLKTNVDNCSTETREPWEAVTVVVNVSDDTDNDDANEEIAIFPPPRLVRRHATRASLRRFVTDTNLLLSEQLLEEWQGNSFSLLRSWDPLDYRVGKNVLSRVTVPGSLQRTFSYFFNGGEGLDHMSQKASQEEIHEAVGTQNSFLALFSCSSLPHDERNVEESSVCEPKTADPLVDAEQGGLDQWSTTTDQVTERVLMLEESSREEDIAIRNICDMDSVSATDLYTALYDKRIEGNDQPIDITPLKTPLNTLRDKWDNHLTTYSPSVALLEKGGRPSFFQEYNRGNRSGSEGEVMTPGGPNSQNLSWSNCVSPSVVSRWKAHDTSTTPLSSEASHQTLLQAFETPVKPPGTALYKASIDTVDSGAHLGIPFRFHTAPSSVQRALCREVGFSKRTIRLLEHLSYRLAGVHNASENRRVPLQMISFADLVDHQSTRTVAATFFELLILKTRLYVDIYQPSESISFDNSLVGSREILISLGTRYKDLIVSSSPFLVQQDQI